MQVFPPRAPKPRRTDLLPMLVALLAALFLLAHFDLKPVVGDEGVLAMDGWRMDRGQVPHRDFFQFIPPMAGFLQAVSVRILGPSVLSLRMAGLLCGILLIVALHIVASNYLVSSLARSVPLAVLVPFGAGAWPFASHHWWVAVFLLVALALLGKSSGSEVPFPWALPAGILLGAAVLTLQDQGSYALLGTLAVGIPLFRPGRRRMAYAGVVSGFAAAALPPVLFLAWKAGWARLWQDYVLFPFQGYHGTAGNRVGFAQGVAQVLAQWDSVALRVAPAYTTLIALASMVIYALPLLCLASLAVAWRRRWIPPPLLALLGVFCAAFIGAAFHRWSLMNLIWAASLPAVAASLALDRGLASPSVPFRRLAGGICIGILVVFCGFGVLRIWASRPSKTHTVTTLAGSYRVFNPNEARDLQSFCDAVGVLVPPGEPAFCFGFCPLLNFLTGHPNPTAFNFLITPGYDGPGHIARWIGDIEREGTQWGFGLTTPADPADPADTFLRAHFRPVWANGTFVLWKRVAPPRGSGESR